MGSRTWIKLYCDKWLSGTIREESPILRSIYVDLLALVGDGEYGDSGVISLKNSVGMTDSQIEKMLKITRYQWQNAKKRLIFTKRISVNQDNVITIINWKKYQSEYERQRTYRNKKLPPEVTTESYTGERKRYI